MKFDAKRLFPHDAAILARSGMTLDALMNAAADVSRTRQALSGLEDIVEAQRICLEYATTSYALMTFKELARASTGAEIDDLYNEPVTAQRTFTRSVFLHPGCTYADPDLKFQKTGWDFSQPVKMGLSVLELRMQDYYPEAGDELLLYGRVYQLGKVYVSVDKFFAQTGIPLWVTAEAEILRQGDARPEATIHAAPASAFQSPLQAAMLSRLQG
jgi:hypothetical protein